MRSIALSLTTTLLLALGAWPARAQEWADEVDAPRSSAKQPAATPPRADAATPAQLDLRPRAPSPQPAGGLRPSDASSATRDVSALGALWRSAVAPGWGQFATDRPIRGALFSGATAASLVTTVVLAVRTSQANTHFEQAPLRARDALHAQAANYATATNVLIATTAALWLLGAGEAFLFY